MTPQQLQALSAAAKAAVDAEKATGCPAELTLSQWALESGWGAHQPQNNCFGIKAYSACYGKQLLQTTEYVKGKKISVPQWFATFPTLADCFKKHSELITTVTPYVDAFTLYKQNHDLYAFVRGVAAHYATDPNYALLLMKLIGQTQVQSALSVAREAA